MKITELLNDYECVGREDSEGITILHFESSSPDLLSCEIHIPTELVEKYDLNMFTRK